MQALRDFFGDNAYGTSAYTLSKAYDCYLATLRRIHKKIDIVLGRDGPNERLKRACPACTYQLEGELKLPYEFLCAADGNMSLKRFKKAGTVDTSKFDSNYILPADEVNQFANKVQIRRKKQKDTGQAEKEPEEARDEKPGGSSNPRTIDTMIRRSSIGTSNPLHSREGKQAICR